MPILSFGVVAVLAVGRSLPASSAEMAMRELVADGLETPTNMTSLPDGRIFVIEPYAGRIRVIEDGKLLEDPFLSVHDRLEESPHVEGGLLGVAFPPKDAPPEHAYVTYTDKDGALQLSHFALAADGRRALPDSEQILLSITDREYRWHNCGHIEFARDGMLYMCVGDMDRNGNPTGSSQDLESLKGKIFRIDPEDDEVDPEIIGYGLRNAWRYTVLPDGGLIIPDVGYESWEELNVLDAATPTPANFGWNLAEGNDCREGTCEVGLVWPLYVYPHDGYRCAIIGGAVYDGKISPAWDGVYFFSDFCDGTIWAIRNLGAAPEIRKVSEEFMQVAAIAKRADGEIIVSDFGEGAVYRLRLPPDYTAGWESLTAQVERQSLEARRSGVHSSKNDLEELHRSRRWAVVSRVFAVLDMLMGR